MYFCFDYKNLKSMFIIQNRFMLQKCSINIWYSKTFYALYIECVSLWCKLRNLKHKELNVMKDFYGLVGEECAEKWFAKIWRMRNGVKCQTTFMRRSINLYMTIQIYKLEEFSIV